MRLGHNRTFFDKALEVVHLSKCATRYTECIYIPTALHSIFRIRYLHEVLTWNLFTAMSIHSFNGPAQMVSKSADRWILRRAKVSFAKHQHGADTFYFSYSSLRTNDCDGEISILWLERVSLLWWTINNEFKDTKTSALQNSRGHTSSHECFKYVIW